MPYGYYPKKQYNRKGKYRKKNSWYERKYSAKDVAIMALKKAKWIRSMLNTEKKYFDSENTAQAVSPT